jgi:hypothetical protein
MVWTKLQELIKYALCGSTIELSADGSSLSPLRCLLPMVRSLARIILPDRLLRPDSNPTCPSHPCH